MDMERRFIDNTTPGAGQVETVLPSLTQLPAGYSIIVYNTTKVREAVPVTRYDFQVFVRPVNGQKVNGFDAWTLSPYESILLVSDGQNWHGHLGQALRASAKARHSVAQSIPNSTLTTLALDTTDDDSDNGHYPTDNTKIIVKRSKTYHIGGLVSFDVSAVGSRQAGISLNGVGQFIAFTAGPADPAGNAVIYTLVDTHVLAPTDYIQLWAFQSSGAPMNITTAQLWITEGGK